MEASRGVRRFLLCREGIVLAAYPDPVICSAGAGIQVPHMKAGDPVTLTWTFATFRHGVDTRARELSARINVPLKQQEFDALLSIYYNKGNQYMPVSPRKPGDKYYDCPDILSPVNAGNLDGAADLIPLCDMNAAGNHVPGLRMRRLKEQAMLVHGDYSDEDTIPFWRGMPKLTKRETYDLKPGDID